MSSGFARSSFAHNGGARVAVIGAGPNGLTAAAVLAQAGCRVEVFESADDIGGSARTYPAFGAGSAVDFGAEPAGADQRREQRRGEVLRDVEDAAGGRRVCHQHGHDGEAPRQVQPQVAAGHRQLIASGMGANQVRFASSAASVNRPTNSNSPPSVTSPRS